MRPALPNAKARALAGAVGLAFCSCAQNGQHQPASSGNPQQPAGANAAAAVRSDLDRDIDLQVTNIEVKRGSIGHLMPMDSPQNDIDTFVFTGTNRSAKAMSSFSATIALQNQRGDALYKGALGETDVVPPSGSFVVRITVVNDTDSLPNPELVRSVSLAQTRLRYRVQAITYADGTKATAAPAP